MTATHTYCSRPRRSCSTSRDSTSTTATPAAITGWTSVTGAKISARTWNASPNSISMNPASHRGDVARLATNDTIRPAPMAGSCPSACFSTIRP